MPDHLPRTLALIWAAGALLGALLGTVRGVILTIRDHPLEIQP